MAGTHARDGVTELLARWNQGDIAARDALIPLVYDELRRVARREPRRTAQRAHFAGHCPCPRGLYAPGEPQADPLAGPNPLFRIGGAKDAANPRRPCARPQCSEARRRRPGSDARRREPRVGRHAPAISAIISASRSEQGGVRVPVALPPNRTLPRSRRTSAKGKGRRRYARNQSLLKSLPARLDRLSVPPPPRRTRGT